MRSVLFVSKPIAPPWNDGSKNLVRDIARGLTRHEAHVMAFARGRDGAVVTEGVYATAGSFAPALASNARVFARLLGGARCDLWHFFFAPNPPSLRAGALVSRLRGAPTVHTVASAPDNLERVAQHLFADLTVVLSEHTKRRLAAVGVAAEVIPPALSEVSVTSEAIARVRTRYALPEVYALYPGDLEFSNGAETFVRAAAKAKSVGWVVASRPKTARAAEARARLEDLARREGATVRWLGEIDDIHAVVAGAAVTAMAVDTLHAKIDLPLVLLESLRLGVPIVVADGTSAGELVASGGALSLRAGDAEALADAVTALVDDSARREAMGAAGGAWVARVCAPGAVAAAYEALYDRLR